MRTKRFKGRTKLTPWLSDEAKKSKRHRRRLERIWTRTGADADRLAYRRACRTTNSVIVESRRSYIADQLECAADSKQKWNTVKKLLHPGSCNAAAAPDDPGESFANTVAKYFLDKISDLKVAIAGRLGGRSANPLSHDSPLLQTDLCALPSVTPSEVERLIRSMAGKSSPLDIILTTLLKRCPDIFSVAISHLANLSFQQGKFPSGYKVAQVTPLLKKDGLDQDNPANYRPISNLFTISKLLERLFLVRLKEHVNTSKQFNMYQSAYRHHHSTETALLKILDDVYISIDGKKVTCLAALDLSAAFDTLDHSTLLDRLESSFRIGGESIAWIRSYLSNRTQSVMFEGIRSPPTPCDCGVPQGSVLGPFFFSMFISPVATVIASHNVSFHQFADDTQLYIGLNPRTPEDSLGALNQCSTDVLNWFTNNGLSLNPTKTEVLFLGTRPSVSSVKSDSRIHIAGCSIEPTNSLKSLGVILDNSLSFDKHTDMVCKVCYFHIRALRHIRNTLSLDMAKTIAVAITGSRLDYCNSVLYGTSAKNIRKLQKVQNTLARVVTIRRRSEHITPILKHLHWLPIEHRITFKIATLTYKIRQSHEPGYLASILSEHEPSRNLRSAGKFLLAVPRARTVSSSRRFSIASPTVWNDIPLNIKLQETIAGFKRHLKTFLFKSAFN